MCDAKAEQGRDFVTNESAMSDEKNCQFSILVFRGAVGHSKEEWNQLSETERSHIRRTASGPEHFGHVGLQLKSEDGQIYNFDLAVEERGGKLHIVPILLGMNVRATVVSEAVNDKEYYYDDRIDYQVTHEQYEQIFREINKWQDTHYNLYTKNCVHFAFDIAKNAGLEVPSVMMTPNGLSRHIQSLDKSQKAQEVEGGNDTSEKRARFTTLMGRLRGGRERG